MFSSRYAAVLRQMVKASIWGMFAQSHAENPCQSDQASPLALHTRNLQPSTRQTGGLQQTALLPAQPCFTPRLLHIGNKQCMITEIIKKKKSIRCRKQEYKGAKLCSASASAFHHLLSNSTPPYLPPSPWSHSYTSFTLQPITPSYQSAFPCHCFLLLHDAKKEQGRSQYLFKRDTVWH